MKTNEKAGEPTHTPGPWHWEWAHGAYSLQNDAGRQVCDDGSACDEYNRAIDPADEGESGANARLIAAAPDLLLELQQAVMVIEALHGAPAWEIFYNNAPEMRRIRAAIAKATGRAV